MATKNRLLSFKQDSVDIISTDKSRYSNLNLNQNHKCVDVSLVQSKSTSLTKNKSLATSTKIDLKTYQKCEEKGNLQFSKSKIWNPFDEVEKEVKNRLKNTSSNSTSTKNNSTLSLHIAAYENLIEAGDTVPLSSSMDEREKELKNANLGFVYSTTSIIQNPFEFPRQQKSDASMPGIMQFKASQQLLNPNQFSASKSGQQGIPKTSVRNFQSIMGKTKRPKSKEEKLRGRRKHFLDDPVREELFLDKGGKKDTQSDDDLGNDDDDMPEEISTKKSEQREQAPPLPEKKKKKRRVKKEGPGIYQIHTPDVKLKVVAAASTPAPAQMLHPPVNFRELLLQESTKGGRRSSGRVSKHVEKWIKPR